MPVPWEAMIPMGLVVVMFGVTGTGYNLASHIANGGRPLRHNIDTWDEMMMRRDERLTGKYRGQSIDPKAPAGYATSSIWETEKVKAS
ncbi:NADH-UBIQUINONE OXIDOREDUCTASE MWFE SUBUNIT [Ceraceosorus bombacis]|uniref:NADH dehydrogenase [ubiquinone] 1 alpha subcomplex subunit 1 n=2 Tax=Ceraceosorus TaxID=401624 RepID=A0A0P1B9Z6_9BASI|nr:hypothetical protein IE81DRAFT_306670 [Ceraceosorus guamensis]PWN39375.1 hypothetical protein IE81DRAFT_306670 [Ceraceosorus guamensis]CEH12423.1 NADH-UBIQUINONE OXIDOREDUCTASE MWFE SUBUNIT [Ceraceosorus bombacis]